MKNIDTPPAPRIDGFSFVRALGAGSTANVYLYRHATTNRLAAIKVSRESLASAVAAHLVMEADMMAQLSSHPHILSVYGTGVTSQGLRYIIAEYAPGGSYQQLTQTRPLTCEQMLDLGVKMCGALADAHRAGIIHHDIKTSNILINANGLPALADFGISSTIYDKRFTGYSLPWAAPEVVKGHAGREAADIYSLGATLYATLTGKSPFEDQYQPRSTDELAQLIANAPVPALNSAIVPTDVNSVLHRAMHKQPESRYHRALDFARELQRLQQTHFGYITPVVAQGTAPYPSQRTAPSPITTVKTAKNRNSHNSRNSRNSHAWAKPIAAVLFIIAALAAIACLFAFIVVPRMDSVPIGKRTQIIMPEISDKSGANLAVSHMHSRQDEKCESKL